MTQKQKSTITNSEKSNFTQIFTKELLNKIEKPDSRIIDVRSVDAYNGWKEQNGGCR